MVAENGDAVDFPVRNVAEGLNHLGTTVDAHDSLEAHVELLNRSFSNRTQAFNVLRQVRHHVRVRQDAVERVVLDHDETVLPMDERG